MYILVVEDEPQVANNLAELVKNEGHTANIAHTIAAARGLIHERIPDVVFLDIFLPDGNGLDLLDAIKGVAFVVITGTPQEQTINEALARGVSAYLAKPFRLDDVLDALAKVGKGSG